MGENSGISWTDHTFNGWIGCTEAGPGCVLCYARELDKRYQWGVKLKDRDAQNPKVAPHWGIGVPRYRTSPANWHKPLVWNREAEARGRPTKVFSHSLSDVFDKEIPRQWREDLFAVWRRTPWLRWIVVTKRTPLIRRYLPDDWGDGYPNVGLVSTVCNQLEFDRHASILLRIPARWHGFSMEPQLGQIVLPPRPIIDHRGTIWCITGGESAQPTCGVEPRPYDLSWTRGLIAASRLADNMKVFVKQVGARPIGMAAPKDGAGADPASWPADIRVQDFAPELLA